jgi:Protein of unknown function (DUF3431)
MRLPSLHSCLRRIGIMSDGTVEGLHAMSEPAAAAPVSPPSAPPPARQLVVARYKEDVSWLPLVNMPAVVYCKNPDCRDAVHVHLPNTKREAGTILHHIVTHYHELARLTYFAQGNPFDHARDFLKRLKITYEEPTSLTQQYLRHHPPPEIKATDKVEAVQGFWVRYGDATNKGHALRSSRGWYNPATWPYLFECPQPAPLWFGYGAMWAVPRSAIRRRPLALWRHLLEVCDPGASNNGEEWTDPPINPWMLEASWYYLFRSPALYPHHRRWDASLPADRSDTRADDVPRCPCRQPAADAPDGVAVCGLGRGDEDGRVTFADCLACLHGQGASS